MKEELPAASATLKLTCGSEGWGVWTDDLHRIVGLCVADDQTTEVHVRLRQFVERHASADTARAVYQFVHPDLNDHSSHPWPDGWWSFETRNIIPEPRFMGEQACIEFRIPK
jgi:hypothetical protein